MKGNRFGSLLLFHIEEYLPAIILRTDCEVHPQSRTSHLDNKLIEVLLGFIRYIQQDNSIAESLLNTQALDIRSTAHEMITR